MPEKILPNNIKKRKWTAVGLTSALSGLLTIWGIYGIGEYGIALFVITPLFIGVSSTILYGYKMGITKKSALGISFLTLAVLASGLFVFAIEGLICLFMAAPAAILLTWLGSLIGYALLNKTPDNELPVLLLLLGLIPTMAFMEREHVPALTAVVTSVEIAADPMTVWNNVVAFPQLPEPDEFIFKTGIAYPVNAKIDGAGVGAIRHCNFTTGSFVEPVTAWEEARILAFDVAEQPATMNELSFWDIDAPHLHDYFVSRKGQFLLRQLSNGNTELEGTTWYFHNIKPVFYWQLWSDYILHSIHDRVLAHIKVNSERAMIEQGKVNQ